jgi:hypothetical protein
VGVKFVDQPHMFSRAATDKLVEKLVGGTVHETTREGAGGGASQAVMVDIGSYPDDLEEQRTVIRFPVEKVRRIA